MATLLIVYDTRSGNTERMALAIAEGARSLGDQLKVVVKKALNTRLQELAEADAIALGSPTHYNTLSYLMVNLLGDLKRQEVSLEGKLGAAFGSYAFTGPVVGILNEAMEGLGVKLVGPGVRALRQPSPETLEECYKVGRTLGEAALGASGKKQAA
jgi:flavorubredoxin